MTSLFVRSVTAMSPVLFGLGLNGIAEFMRTTGGEVGDWGLVTPNWRVKGVVPGWGVRS